MSKNRFGILIFLCWQTWVLAQNSPSYSPLPTTAASQQTGIDRYQAALDALGSGDRVLAQELLEEVVRTTPSHAGAWLDLALLYCEIGDQAAAYTLFDRIERELQAPLSIQSLIARARERGCRSPRKWLAQAQVSLGRATNVNYAPSSSLIRFAPNAPFGELFLGSNHRPQADHYLNTELMWVLPKHQNNWMGAQWHALVQAKEHQNIQDFNTQMGAAGATWRGYTDTKNDWGLRLWELSVHTSHTRLGGNAYETVAQLWGNTWSGDQSYEVGRLGRLIGRWGYEWGLAHFNYPSQPIYNSLRSDFRLRAQMRWQQTTVLHTFTTTLGPVWDQDMQGRPGGQRWGQVWSTQWAMQWAHQHQLVVYLQQQKLREQSPYSPLFFGTQRRSPNYMTWGARYQRELGLGQAIYLQWLEQQTTDTIELFSYKNQSLVLGYQWSF